MYLITISPQTKLYSAQFLVEEGSLLDVASSLQGLGVTADAAIADLEAQAHQPGVGLPMFAMAQ